MQTLNATDRHGVLAVDVYNQSVDGDIVATLTAACGGSTTSGPKVMAVDFRNGKEQCVNGTLQSKGQWYNLN